MDKSNISYEELSTPYKEKNKDLTPGRFSNSFMRNNNEESSFISSKNMDSRGFMIAQLKRDIAALKDQNFNTYEMDKQLTYRERQCEQLTREIFDAQERHNTFIVSKHDRIADFKADIENLNFRETEQNSEYETNKVNSQELIELKQEKEFEYIEIKKEQVDAISIREELEMNIIADKKELSIMKTAKNQAQSKIEVDGLKLQEQTYLCEDLNEEYKEVTIMLEQKEKDLTKYIDKLDEIDDVNNKIEIQDKETLDEIDKLDLVIDELNGRKQEIVINVDDLEHTQKDHNITLNRHNEDSTQLAKDYDEIDGRLKARILVREKRREELNKIKESLEETKLKNEFLENEIEYMVTVINAMAEKE